MFFKASLLQLKSGKLEGILTKRSYLKVKSKQPYICLVLGFQTPRSKILLFIGYALEESRQTTKSWWTTLWSSWSRPWPGKATRHQAGKARARSRPWTGSWQRYDIWQFSCQIIKVSFYKIWFDGKIILTSFILLKLWQKGMIFGSILVKSQNLVTTKLCD